jgi:hypothetical protein
MVDNHREEYGTLIQKYEKTDFFQKDIDYIKQDILRDDRRISELLESEGVIHYRYFQNNYYYCQLVCKKQNDDCVVRKETTV